MRLPLPVLEHDVEDDRPDVHHLALDRVNAAKLWREISRLPPQQRDAVILREVAGLSYDELALLLGVTRPGVESLLFRARGRLRTRLRTALASVNAAGLASEAAAAVARLAGQGAAPLAVKAAAVGVGVAVVGGGGLVAEQRLEPHEPATMPAVAAAAPPRPTPRPAPTRPALVVRAATRPAAAVPPVVAETEGNHVDDGPGPRDEHVRGGHRGREREGREHGEATSVALETVPHFDGTTTTPVAAVIPAPTTNGSSGDGPSGIGDVRVTTLATTADHDGGHDGDTSSTTTAVTTTVAATTATTTTSGGDGHDGGGSSTTGTTTDGHDGGSGSDGGTSGPH